MSDYLGNLAAKSLAPEQAPPALQPRLASVFEPVGPEIREPQGFVEENIETVVAPQPAPRASEPLSALPSPERGDQGVRSRRAERSAEQSPPKATPEERPEPSPEPLRKPEPARRRASSAPVPVEMEPVQGAVARRIEVPSEASPPGPLSHRPSPDRERGNVERAVVAKAEPIQRPTVIPVPVRQDQPDTSPLSRPGEGRWERGPGGEASRASLPEVQKSPEQSPVLPILQPQVTLPERLPFPVRPESPAPEPVIHVTIGRIEVRATPASKAPARERQAAGPPVDLEEYLLQRSRGEGR